MYIYKRLLCDENGLNDTYLSSYVKEIINKETNKLEIDLSFLVYKKSITRRNVRRSIIFV